MHSRLARQLRRHAAGVELPPALQPLLDGISAAFADIDRERALHGAAMDALSLEMTARYERLQRSEAEYRELSETLLAAERAHRDADARYRAIFENAGVAIFLLGWSGTITEVNEAACALLGYARAELLGRDASGFLLREDAASVSEPLGQLRSGLRDVVSIERRLRHREGHIVWVQLTGSVVELEGGRTLALVLQDITARKAMELQLVEQAFSDDLTGLANRALFRDRLRHALDRRARANGDVGVLLLDFDGFKRVNDSLGHAAGDALLVTASRRLEAVVRSDETVARLGGDEFAILVEECHDASALEQLAGRILAAFRDPIHVTSAGREVVIGTSIGIAVAQQDDDAESVLRNADTAMYAAKAAGRRQWRRFDPSMHGAALEWLELEADLRTAVERRQLALVFQPVVDLGDGVLRGVEALLRWTHPERGALAPETFIPIAEETGLIVGIGRWVLMQACLHGARWSAVAGRALTVSVNVSARQLESESLLGDVREALAASGLPATSLVLELTESDVIRFPLVAIERLVSLREMGVRISIDDFGTGYSSLAHLQAFPVDELKIDRRFVARMDQGERDAAFVRAIVALARSLSVEVVAEGIEEVSQRLALRHFGCDVGQGFLFSRPVPAGEVDVMFGAGAGVETLAAIGAPVAAD